MKIILAGYNIQKSLIDQLPDKELATPEVISAAYARISRSAKSITSLHTEAVQEVGKCRQSNETIIFEMGHSSIAEHAVFNIDLIGISRLLGEVVQKSRLASFTEKSQRYVTLEGEYIIPREIKGMELEERFNKIVSKQVALYHRLYELGIHRLEEQGFSGKKRELEGRVKEDARYLLPLAMQTQMGMTINARSLERLLRRLDKTPFVEAKHLHEALLKEVRTIAPSLVRYTQSDDYDQVPSIALPPLDAQQVAGDARLIWHTPQVDETIIAGLYFEQTGQDPQALQAEILRMDEDTKAQILGQYFSKMKAYHATPRAFEMAEFQFTATMSSCCFGQLKRHRLATILRTEYQPDLGFVIPPFLAELGMKKEITSLLQDSADLAKELDAITPGLGGYLITNGSKLQVCMKMNMRELYHFVRLRSDEHAQWEIRDLSDKLVTLVKEVAPLTSAALQGKHLFQG